MKNLSALLVLGSLSVNAATVELDLNYLNMREGTVLIAVFNDPGTFPDKAPFKTISVPVKDLNSTKTSFELPAGDYAISLFLDENGNKKLDTNFLGIPKERFGFSNNPRILTGAPSYQDCDFRVESETKKMEIRLIKLF